MNDDKFLTAMAFVIVYLLVILHIILLWAIFTLGFWPLWFLFPPLIVMDGSLVLCAKDLKPVRGK